MDRFLTMIAYYLCDSLNTALCFNAVGLFTNSPEHCSWSQPQGRLPGLIDQLQQEAAVWLSTQLVGGGEESKKWQLFFSIG